MFLLPGVVLPFPLEPAETGLVAGLLAGCREGLVTENLPELLKEECFQVTTRAGHLGVRLQGEDKVLCDLQGVLRFC